MIFIQPYGLHLLQCVGCGRYQRPQPIPGCEPVVLYYRGRFVDASGVRPYCLDCETQGVMRVIAREQAEEYAQLEEEE